MELVKQYKNILIAVGVLLLVFGGYYFWKNKNPGEDLSLSNLRVTSDFASSPGAQAGQQIISILNDLSQIKIDRGVFEHPVFMNLVDHTISVTEEDRGRPDPFAPLPFESITPGQTAP